MTRLLDQYAQPLPAPRQRRRLDAVRRLQARYDAARTTDENAGHWVQADALSAGAALTPDVRRTLRMRARYEVANNSYAAGMVRTLAHDAIGTGPALQLQTGDEADNAAGEEAFWRWSEAVRLPEKLRTLRMARCADGEAFGLITTNLGLPSAVKIDLRPVEADQFAQARMTAGRGWLSDGITYDDFGNPLSYTMLRYHPGDLGLFALPGEAETIPARDVIHLFRCERPGQLRGVPEITPALPLYAQLRRYTLAVIAAAETAADIAAFLETQQAPDNPDDVEPLDLIDLPRRSAMSLPQGWAIKQIKAEQPTTTYAMFKREIVAEIARCLSMPFNVAAGDSSSYNYSSGRLDHKTYFKSIRVDRSDIERDALDVLFGRWWQEACLVPGALPEGLRARNEPPPHAWRWDGEEHIDPVKDANAAIMLIDAGLLTHSEYAASQGGDWIQQQIQRAAELGLTLEAYRQRLAARMAPPAAPQQEGDDDAPAR